MPLQKRGVQTPATQPNLKTTKEPSRFIRNPVHTNQIINSIILNVPDSMELSKHESEVSLTQNLWKSQETNIMPKKVKRSSRPLKNIPKSHFGLKSPLKSNITLGIPIRVSEPRILTKVNPKDKLSTTSNLGSQILKKNLNLKSTTLIGKIPHFGIDEIPF